LESEEIDKDEPIKNELIMIDEFLDIYENSSVNEEIMEVVASVDGNLEETPILETMETVTELKESVPYNTGISEALDEVTEEIMEDIKEEYDVSTEELDEMYLEEYDVPSDETSGLFKEDLTYDNMENKADGLVMSNLIAVDQQVQQLAYKGNLKFNISKGVKYAKKYAKKQNSKYRYFKRDCTNFVSQIKKAGVYQRTLKLQG